MIPIYIVVVLYYFNQDYEYIKKKIDKTQIIRYNEICIRLSYSIMDACIVGFLGDVLGGIHSRSDNNGKGRTYYS